MAGGVETRTITIELQDVNDNLRLQDSTSMIVLGGLGLVRVGERYGFVGGKALFQVQAGSASGLSRLRDHTIFVDVRNISTGSTEGSFNVAVFLVGGIDSVKVW